MTDVRQRRGASVDDAVLSATLELLNARGYEFTIEDVAARAEVHKTTIYRRWISKPALIAAAIARLGDHTVIPELSDDPLADLEDLAVQVAEALARPIGRNPLIAALAAAGSDPQLASTADSFFQSRYRIATPAIESAQSRGMIAAELDPILIWQAIVNPMHLDAICGRETTPDRARRLVRLVLDGARPRRGTDS